MTSNSPIYCKIHEQVSTMELDILIVHPLSKMHNFHQRKPKETDKNTLFFIEINENLINM